MSQDIKKTQRRLLELATTISNIFELNNVQYMITFGTLLGAVRHKGFIPWDDDFDFFVLEEDYENVIEILRNHLPADMILEDKKSEPLYFHAWAHVKDIKTITNCTQFSQDNIYAQKGLSIDLYKAIKMDERDVDLFRLKEQLSYRKREYKAGIITKEELNIFKKDLICKIKDEEKRIATVLPLGDVLGMVVNERMMELQDVFPLKKYDFENTQFYGPNNADKLLTSFYGKYMELPPKEKRLPHYDEVVFLD